VSKKKRETQRPRNLKRHKERESTRERGSKIERKGTSMCERERNWSREQWREKICVRVYSCSSMRDSRNVAVCCNVLQCVIVRCGVLSCSQDHNTAGMLQRCSVLECVGVCCSVLQCVAILRYKNCCNVTALLQCVLQCVLQHDECCCVLQFRDHRTAATLQCDTVCCSVSISRVHKTPYYCSVALCCSAFQRILIARPHNCCTVARARWVQLVQTPNICMSSLTPMKESCPTYQ